MKKLAATTKTLLASMLKGIKSMLVSALFWLVVLGLAGAVLVSLGVGLQFSLGYSLVAAGCFCVLYASLILRGIGGG